MTVKGYSTFTQNSKTGALISDAVLCDTQNITFWREQEFYPSIEDTYFKPPISPVGHF